jgi:hypothetical protein
MEFPDTSYDRNELKSNKFNSPHFNLWQHLKKFDAVKRWLYICILMFCKIKMPQMEIAMRLLVK